MKLHLNTGYVGVYLIRVFFSHIKEKKLRTFPIVDSVTFFVCHFITKLTFLVYWILGETQQIFVNHIFLSTSSQWSWVGTFIAFFGFVQSSCLEATHNLTSSKRHSQFNCILHCFRQLNISTIINDLLITSNISTDDGHGAIRSKWIPITETYILLIQHINKKKYIYMKNL